MGYRSEVAYAIVFKSTEDRDTILSRITHDQRDVIHNECDVREDRILFHEDSVKWYLSRDLEAYGLKGYESVDAHDALLQAAKDAQWDRDSTDDDENNDGVYSLGVFIRLGEDDSDTERDSWGEYDAPEGFPEVWDLVSYHRSIDVGWL